VFFEKLSSFFKFHRILTKTIGTLREHLSLFMRAYRWILRRIRKFQTNTVDKMKTNILFFYRKSRGLWDNVEKHGIDREATQIQYGTCALHAGYLRLQKYSSTFSLTSSLDRDGWLVARPGRFTSGTETRWPLCRRQGVLQGRPGRLRRISSPTEFDPWTIHPVASLYTDWAIPVPVVYICSR
jgi:hypothetical protein